MTYIKKSRITLPETFTRIPSSLRQYISLAFFAILGFFIRVIGVDKPFAPVFDEHYYIRNTLDLLKHGVEYNSYSETYWLVVHPPLGKWMLAPGIVIFGDNSFGWRIMAVLLGSLSIILVGLIAKELFNNFLVTTLSAFFMTFDGIAFLTSRTGILEAPLVFNSLLATLFFVKALKNQKYLPFFGIFIGLTLAVKWNAIYQLVALTFFYTIYTAPRWSWYIKKGEFSRLLKFKSRSLLSFIILPIAVYTLTWIGWFLTKVGQFRDWAEKNGTAYPFIPDALRSFWHYHFHIYDFHQKMNIPHPSSAHAYEWLSGRKPTIFYKTGGAKCSNETVNGAYELCGSIIAQLHNPVILYGSLLSLLLLTTYLIKNLLMRKFNFSHITKSAHTSQSMLILLVLISYLPWLAYYKRTTFNYYIDIFMPYLIIILSYGVVSAASKIKNKKLNRYFILLVMLLTVAFFLYYYPLYTNQFASYQFIDSRLWIVENFKL